eukprot:symbB.v1.2.018976.t1/scaffold1534.1/size113260/6
MQMGRDAGPNPMLLPAEDFLCLKTLAEAVKVAQVPLRPKAFARLRERGLWPEGFSQVDPEAVASPETTVIVEPFMLGEARPWALCAHLAQRLDRVQAKKALPSGVTIVAVLVECLVAQCIKVITTLGGFKRDGFCRGHLWNEMLMPGTCDSFPKDEGWAG